MPRDHATRGPSGPRVVLCVQAVLPFFLQGERVFLEQQIERHLRVKDKAVAGAVV